MPEMPSTTSPDVTSLIGVGPSAVNTMVSGAKHWLTAETDESRVLSHGTMPFDRPFVPRISDPRQRTLWNASPMPPANLDRRATSL